MAQASQLVGQPKTSSILIRNVYYMLLYAWELYAEGIAAEVDAVEADTLQDLLAFVLANGVRRLLRRGLDRSYRSFVEETATPRGTFLLTESMRPGPRSKGTAVCSFDELSYDVPHNRIIKATLRSLGKRRDLASSPSGEMKALASRMMNVSDVLLSVHLFRSVNLGRNNRHYRLLIKVCELIFLSQIPGEGDEGTTFGSLLEDETRMATVFEHFVRNLYRAEQTAFRVRAEEVAWDATFSNLGHQSYLPQMRTDMTMRKPGRTLVIDTKYYQEILRSRMGGVPKLRSEHLYQLLAYLRQVQCDQTVPHSAEGLLLYARAGGTDLDLKYALGGFSVRAYTIDLSLSWNDIRLNLMSLLGQPFS